MKTPAREGAWVVGVVLLAVMVMGLRGAQELRAQEPQEDPGPHVLCLSVSGGAYTPPLPRLIRVFSFTLDSIPPEVPEYWSDRRLLRYLPVKEPNALGLRSEGGLLIGMDAPERRSRMLIELREEVAGRYRGVVMAGEGEGFSRPQGPRTVEASLVDCRELGRWGIGE